jgi:hypothetical protein
MSSLSSGCTCSACLGSPGTLHSAFPPSSGSALATCAEANWIRAIREGRVHYHGRLCKRGHTLRYTRGKTCVECQALSTRRWINKRLPVNDARHRNAAAFSCATADPSPRVDTRSQHHAGDAPVATPLEQSYGAHGAEGREHLCESCMPRRSSEPARVPAPTLFGLPYDPSNPPTLCADDLALLNSLLKLGRR